MAPINFATEIWEQIRDQLIMPELRELSLTCKYLRRVCAKRLKKQQRIAHAYRWIDAMDDKAGGRIFIFHDALFHILRGELSPTYICSVDGDETCIEDPEAEQQFHEADFATMRKETNMIKPLIQRAVEDAFWIEDSEKEQFVEAICIGREDEVLCILIPLLTNLRALRPPLNAPFLERTVRRISRASSLLTAKPLPLRNLLLVNFWAANGDESGVGLQEVMSYAALPSVRRVILSHGRGSGYHFPGWSTDLPLSRVSEVYFDRSSFTKIEVSGFTRGFAGPCIMRQWWVAHGSHIPVDNFNVDWDYIELGGGGERVEGGIKPGSRSEIMELRYPKIHGDGSSGQSDLAYSDQMNRMLEGRLSDWKALMRSQS